MQYDDINDGDNGGGKNDDHDDGDDDINDDAELLPPVCLSLDCRW